MGLAVQQLLVGAAIDDRGRQASQRVTEKLSVSVTKFRGVGRVANQPLRLRDSISEVWRSQLSLPHPGMQPLQRLGVLWRRDLPRRHRVVVGPQRHHEAVLEVGEGLHPRVELGHRATGIGESPSHLNFEHGIGLMRLRCHPRQDATGQ